MYMMKNLTNVQLNYLKKQLSAKSVSVNYDIMASTQYLDIKYANHDDVKVYADDADQTYMAFLFANGGASQSVKADTIISAVNKVTAQHSYKAVLAN